jgi:hypothetical protein
MTDEDWALILWVFATILLAWTWIPALISGLGGVRVQYLVQETAAFDVEPNDPEFMEWYVKVLDLGYEAHGKGRMRIVFAGPRWVYDSRLLVFYSNREKTFLLLQRQPAPFSVWAPVTFVTCWTSGGLLVTSSALDLEPGEIAEYTTQGLSTTDLVALSDYHQSQAKHMRDSGFRNETDLSMDLLFMSFRRLATPKARYRFIKQGQVHLAMRFLFHGAVTLIWISWTELLHPLVPGFNILFGLAFMISEYFMQRRMGLKMKNPSKMRTADEPQE